MKLLQLAIAITITATMCCPVQAYVLTFDDVPTGTLGSYYNTTYGISLDYLDLVVVDHTGSQWGPPNSGSNVLVVAPGFSNSRLDTMFKGQAVWSVYSFGAFFSTEESVVLQMVGYNGGLDNPVSSAYIGGTGQSWHNEYVEINSPAGNISMVEFYPVSADAFHHFCLDDLTVVPVPEPSSLLALLAGLGSVGGVMLKRRRL